MKISARNQVKGNVTNINEGAVNAIVSIEANGEVISSTISLNAVKELGLKKGDAVNDILTLETKLGVVSSTISKNAVEELELSVGKEAYAIIKATSVMVGIE